MKRIMGDAKIRSIRLPYLDGIRGLAALYVLLEHAQLCGLDLIHARHFAPTGATPTQQFARLLNATLLGFGHAAVDVFIVLSGFCLMLPVVHRSDRQLDGGLRRFVKRRAVRILPSYYAALLVALLVMALGGATPMLTPGIVLSHLLLIHNLSPAWLFGISAPLWSVAVEWQIYFVFALLLLPVWRRFGTVTLLIIAFAIGLGPLYLLPVHWNIECSCPWYVGLFALGMVGAVFGVSRRSALAGTTPRSWAALAMAAALAGLLLHLLQLIPTSQRYLVAWCRTTDRNVAWPLDVASGIAIACAMTGLARAKLTGGHGHANRILNALESRIASGLGKMSYSLYLVNCPVLGAWGILLGTLNFAPALAYTLWWMTAVPVGILGAYLFYVLVERRCLDAKRGTIAPTRSGAVFALGNRG
jgi:peptidoglycan/LPS O-acetylase OafA/YrhL